VWSLVIVLVSFPFESFQTHAHWDKIGWIPFYSWPVRVSDILGNLALYFPLGFLALRRRSHPPYVVVVLAAFTLSLAMETIQDFSHGRFPAATDLVCNVSGALLGVYVASRTRTS
jgi:glycopeptide antibiotics resistance protein